MRNMKNLNQKQAKKHGWNILVPFVPDSEVIGKATYDDGVIRIMKSTKRFIVPGGWLYNTTTEIHKFGNVAVAEALAFVPDII